MSRTGHWSVRDFNYLKISSSDFSSGGHDVCRTSRVDDVHMPAMRLKANPNFNREAQEDYRVATRTNESYSSSNCDTTANDNRLWYRRRRSASFLLLRMIRLLTSCVNRPFGHERCIVRVPDKTFPVFSEMQPFCVTDLSFCITFCRERGSQTRCCQT